MGTLLYNVILFYFTLHCVVTDLYNKGPMLQSQPMEKSQTMFLWVTNILRSVQMRYKMA